MARVTDDTILRRLRLNGSVLNRRKDLIPTGSVWQDFRANRGNPKGQMVMLLFRLAQRGRATQGLMVLPAFLYLVAYRVLVEWVLGVELPWGTAVGPRLRLHHGQALVVNDGSTIGADCVLRHATTLGHVASVHNSGSSSAPTLGDRVDVGSNVVILGPIHIGADSVIGAGSVVVNDVAPGSVVVGNPARVVSSTQS